ncbi:MAG: RNA 2',3'-cyclic phosphodiesterase [Deltaproteobacteria bacterium]
MVRAFLAIDLPDELSQGIGKAVSLWRKTQKGRISWTPPENLHVTLLFLGDVLKESLHGISAACRHAARGIFPFTLEPKGTGVFPNAARPRVLWIGLSGDLPRLFHLHDELESAINALGRPGKDGNFAPHITLGRVRSPLALAEILPTFLADGFSAQAFPVREFVLYQSDLSPRGAIYTPIERFPLAQGGED